MTQIHQVEEDAKIIKELAAGDGWKVMRRWLEAWRAEVLETTAAALEKLAQRDSPEERMQVVDNRAMLRAIDRFLDIPRMIEETSLEVRNNSEGQESPED